jgi:hypothetical protein
MTGEQRVGLFFSVLLFVSAYIASILGVYYLAALGFSSTIATLVTLAYLIIVLAVVVTVTE